METMLKRLLTTTAVLALSAPLAAGIGVAQTSPSPQSAATPPSAASPPAAAAPTKSNQEVERMKPDEVRLSKIIGQSVYGSDEKKIGSVSDLIAEPGGTTISEAVLSVGGFLGVGEKRVAVKMSELKHDATNDRLTIALTKDQLKQAPEYQFAEREPTPTGTSGSSRPPIGLTPPPAAGTSAPPAPPK
jgi:sporulation protein YlmC with PRC-barrel domain